MSDTNIDSKVQPIAPHIDVKPAKRGAVAHQRTQIERLMKNVDKPIELPEPQKRTINPPPEFVLNVRGSSAGAGSSDFHTYREIRRKENLRIKLMETEAKEEEIRERYDKDLGELKRKADEKTAKNRAKRQRRKHKNSGNKTIRKKD